MLNKTVNTCNKFIRMLICHRLQQKQTLDFEVAEVGSLDGVVDNEAAEAGPEHHDHVVPEGDFGQRACDADRADNHHDHCTQQRR